MIEQIWFHSRAPCALQGKRNQEEPCYPASRGRWWVTITDSGRDYATPTWQVIEAKNLRILTQAGYKKHLASDNHGFTRLLSKGHISREDSFRKPSLGSTNWRETKKKWPEQVALMLFKQTIFSKIRQNKGFFAWDSKVIKFVFQLQLRKYSIENTL